MRRLGKSLCKDFCDFVTGPGMPGNIRDYEAWMAEQDVEDRRAPYFWSNLLLCLRDCEHEDAAFVMYRCAEAFARAWRAERDVVTQVGEAVTVLFERIGVPASAIRNDE